MEQVRSRSRWKEIVIVASALLLLALLVWLFLRPAEPARQVVFGDLGRRTTPTNTVAGGPVPGAPALPGSPVTNGAQETANIPMTNEPGADFNGQSARRTEPPPIGQGGSMMEAGSNSAVMGPMTNDIPGNSSAPSSPPLSSQTPIPPSNSVASPNPTSPPSPATESSTRPAHGTYVPDEDTSPQDPAHKDATAKLLAQARAANMPRANPIPARTADLLGNESERLLNPEAGSNVVFILDNSMSMTNGGKSSAARLEVLRALQAMNAGQLFYVLFFHSGGYEGMPALAPLPASPENVRAMTNWLSSAGHRTGADPTKAIQRALGLAPAPDTVWLLSGSPLPDKVIDNIREANASVNARINTIGLYTQEGEEAMRRIADENRGVYRFVAQPTASPP
jgi:hypothetical protein